MAPDCSFYGDVPVSDVIEALLRRVLPSELHAVIPRLAARVASRPDVRPHAGKRWHRLTEGEGNIVAREVGLVAQELRLAERMARAGEQKVH